MIQCSQTVDLWLSSETDQDNKDAQNSVSSSSSSFSVRLLQRIIGGVTFDIESVIISYKDSDKNLCIGTACESISIYK